MTLAKEEEYAADHGRQSPTYRRLWFGEFSEDSSETITTTEHLERAAKRWEWRMKEEASIPYEQYRRGADYVIGVDPARYGPDLTAVCVAQGDLVREFTIWGQCDLMATVARLQADAQQRGFHYYEEGCRRGWHPGRFIIDEPGLGGGVIDKLKLLGYTVVPFNGARTVVEDEWKDGRTRLKNLRAAAYWSLRTLLEEDKIAIPRNPKLWEELVATRWDVGQDGRNFLYPKDEIRLLLGRSPDLADSLSLVAYWMGRRKMTIRTSFVTF